jgi:hypothetical protein
MTSKKIKALRKRHQQAALARGPLHSRLASPRRLSDPPIHTMSDRRDLSPHRGYSRQLSPPRGPRADNRDGGFFFVSDRVRPPAERERYRDRSRSRSPDSARRRASDYNYLGSELYRPSYSSSSPIRPPLPEARRKYQ